MVVEIYFFFAGGLKKFPGELDLRSWRAGPCEIRFENIADVAIRLGESGGIGGRRFGGGKNRRRTKQR